MYSEVFTYITFRPSHTYTKNGDVMFLGPYTRRGYTLIIPNHGYQALFSPGDIVPQIPTTLQLKKTDRTLHIFTDAM